MSRTRTLTHAEIAELVYGLALAKRKHGKHIHECAREELMANDSNDAGFYRDERERYELSEDTDNVLIDLVVGGKIMVVMDEEDEECEYLPKRSNIARNEDEDA